MNRHYKQHNDNLYTKLRVIKNKLNNRSGNYWDTKSRMKFFSLVLTPVLHLLLESSIYRDEKKINVLLLFFAVSLTPTDTIHWLAIGDSILPI